MADEKKADTPNAADSTPKKKKINEMTISEIDAKLAEVKEKQGGLTSKYAHQLAERRKSLVS
jgi:hypothetical protein